MALARSSSQSSVNWSPEAIRGKCLPNFRPSVFPIDPKRFPLGCACVEGRLASPYTLEGIEGGTTELLKADFELTGVMFRLPSRNGGLAASSSTASS